MTSSLTARLVAQHIGAKVARKKHSRHHSKCLIFCRQIMRHDRLHVVMTSCSPAVTAVCSQEQLCCSISCRKSTCRYQMQMQEMSLRSSGSGKKNSAETLELACCGPNLRSKAAVTSRQQVASTGQALCHQDTRLYHFAFGRFGSSSKSSICIHSHAD